MQFPNADDVYNNISLSLTGISAGQKMNLSVPVTFNVKSFEYSGSGEGENPSVTDGLMIFWVKITRHQCLYLMICLMLSKSI